MVEQFLSLLLSLSFSFEDWIHTSISQEAGLCLCLQRRSHGPERAGSTGRTTLLRASPLRWGSKYPSGQTAQRRVERKLRPPCQDLRRGSVGENGEPGSLQAAPSLLAPAVSLANALSLFQAVQCPLSPLLRCTIFYSLVSLLLPARLWVTSDQRQSHIMIFWEISDKQGQAGTLSLSG